MGSNSVNYFIRGPSKEHRRVGSVAAHVASDGMNMVLSDRSAA